MADQEHGGRPPLYTIEGHIAWRVLYRMWRLDEAARAFKKVLAQTDDHEKALVYNRWEIGLTLETENLEKALAHMCLRGLMTTHLSKVIDVRFQWLGIDCYPPVIDWGQLLEPGSPSMGNLSELFDGMIPQIAQGESHWWTYNGNTSTIEDKPYWWDEPEKEKWLFNVSVPRDLVGQYIRRLTQSQELLSRAVTKLHELQDNVPMDLD
ncbi:hypothetical protein QCA50_008508 [Cerrena zonata]|uniref:Uncharacterized protein n=1 Tax=Cerrena zonata TaxID=2478898 RepID=A0AAW0G486_9APHY